MRRGANELWEIDTFNSGENDGYVVDIISYITFAWIVRNHGPNRWRGHSVGAEEKEKDHR
jgi:ABC-type uncharacterized transport system permease subunit